MLQQNYSCSKDALTTRRMNATTVTSYSAAFKETTSTKKTIGQRPTCNAREPHVEQCLGHLLCAQTVRERLSFQRVMNTIITPSTNVTTYLLFYKLQSPEIVNGTILHRSNSSFV